MGWGVVTGPLAAVFLLEGSFSLGEYVVAALQVVGCSLAACLLICAPLVALLGALSRRQMVLARLLPPLGLAVSIFALIFALMHSADWLTTLFGWPGRMVGGMFFFVLYWLTHGLESLLRTQWRRFREHLSSKSTQPVL